MNLPHPKQQQQRAAGTSSLSNSPSSLSDVYTMSNMWQRILPTQSSFRRTKLLSPTTPTKSAAVPKMGEEIDSGSVRERRRLPKRTNSNDSLKNKKQHLYRAAPCVEHHGGETSISSDDEDSTATNDILLLPWLKKDKKGGIVLDRSVNKEKMMRTKLEASASTLSTDLMDSFTSISLDDDDDDVASVASSKSTTAKHVHRHKYPEPKLEPKTEPTAKSVRFAVGSNGRGLKKTIYRYPAATCVVTHGGVKKNNVSKGGDNGGVATTTAADADNTRRSLCARLYWSEQEIFGIRDHHRKRAYAYICTATKYVPCVERLFDGRGFAASTCSGENGKKKPFTEMDAIRLISSSSIRGLEFPCSDRIQAHRKWAKEKILQCQEECRQLDHLDEAVQCLADTAIRVSYRSRVFAWKMAKGDAQHAQQIHMMRDVTTSRRELDILQKKLDRKRSQGVAGSVVKK